jgi:hypothetical protein
MTPKTKKLIYKISISGMIVSAVGFITACRYTYMADTEALKNICIGLCVLFTSLAAILRNRRD